jgi:hypothetical protein
MSTRKAISIALIGLAGFFITAGFGWLLYSWGITYHSLRTTGTVVSLHERQLRNGETVYCPTFQFRDATDMEHIVLSSVGSRPPRFPAGSSVPVLYSPSNPSEAIIEDRIILWILPGIVIMVSFFYGGVGWLIGRWPVKKRKIVA